MNSFVNMIINRVVWMDDVPGVEDGSDGFDIVEAEGIFEDAPQVGDSPGGWLEALGVVKRSCQWSCVNGAPAIA